MGRRGGFLRAGPKGAKTRLDGDVRGASLHAECKTKIPSARDCKLLVVLAG